MKRVAVGLLMAVMPMQVFASAPKKPVAPKQAIKPVLRKPNPCAEYGAGFVQVQGTSTCIRIGGSIGIGGGVSR